MFPTINAEYLAAKRADDNNQFILESVLDVDETLPGSEEEMEEIVDPDSVPEDVYAKIDKELDKIVDDPNYDDTEAEEMLDDDFDVDDITDAEIDAIMDEAVAMIERKEKVAGVIANLSEKAGNNMANNSGMGLLKVLSEAASINQFHNGKTSDSIGDAYEPVETPDKANDETKPEQAALDDEPITESAVDAALARFHALMEEANPDVEDFPGKEGTTTADGDTPAGMPEPNGNEDGANIGGDDDVTDKEAKDVEVEDGGDDAIEVIKANEAVNRYRTIVEKTCPICGEEKGSKKCDDTCTTDKLKEVYKAAKEKLAAKGEICPKCNDLKDSEKCKAECTDAEREGLNESLDNARTHLNDAKIYHSRAEAYRNGAQDAINNNWGKNGGPNGQLPYKRNTMGRTQVTGDDSIQAADSLNRSAKQNDMQALRYLGKAAKEAIKDKRVQAGAAGLGVAALAAKKLHDAKKAKEASATEEKKTLKEAVTNPDVEDFPNQTGAGNDHGEKEGALPQGEEPADFPNSTGDKKVNSGDEPTNRYKAVAEAAIEPIATPFCPTCRKPMAKDTANKRWICPHCGKTRVLRETIENPDVEDFPAKEGTDSVEGDAAPNKMEHCDDSCQPAYTDESDFEQKEVKVEDGGTDVIEVIKANESATLAAARAKLVNKVADIKTNSKARAQKKLVDAQARVEKLSRRLGKDDAKDDVESDQ